MALLAISGNKDADGAFTILPAGSIDSDTYEILGQNLTIIQQEEIKRRNLSQ